MPSVSIWCNIISEYIKKVRPILSYLSFEDSIQIIIDFLCIPPMLPTQSDDNLVTLVEKNNG